MSQSILVKGIYRNNKVKAVGAHNPKNNRFFNDEEIEHLYNMIVKNIEPNYDRFKKIDVIMHLEGRKIFEGEYEVDSLSRYDSRTIVNELIELYKFNEEKQK